VVAPTTEPPQTTGELDADRVSLREGMGACASDMGAGGDVPVSST